MQAHEQIDIKIVLLSYRGKVRGAQILAGNLRAQRLSDLSCFFYLRTSFAKISKVTLHASNIVERECLCSPILCCVRQRKRLLVVG